MRRTMLASILVFLLSGVVSANDLSEALDTSLSFTTGGSANWFGQSATSYYDGDAAQSGDISNNEDSWMRTTVGGAGTVSFYWKVSSEGHCDFLEFYIDGLIQDRISGSADWEQMTYTLPSGSHTLEWRYMKDYSMYFGSDCGWIDQIEWVTGSQPPPPSCDLSEALDTTLSFITGGDADWFCQSETAYYDGDAAQSGDISHDEESWMQMTVSGPATLSFYWKVSSESGCDFLEFYIDGLIQDRISDSADWEQMTYTLPLGSNTLAWRYVKDGSDSTGSDCGWVDKVELVGGSEPPPPPDDAWLNINSSNYDSCCGEDSAQHSLANALDGINSWEHYVNHTHWFILDLGTTYNIKKVKGCSNGHNAGILDPTNVNIYVSDNKTNWGTAVATDISKWKTVYCCTNEFGQPYAPGEEVILQEVDTTPKNGRYIKVEITETADSDNYLEFGRAPYDFAFKIFDAYGRIASASPTIDLSEALDTTLSFSTGGSRSVGWFNQFTTFYFDGDAAQSGDVLHDEATWMETTVSGEGTLSFYWKVSSDSGHDNLEFSIDGTLQDLISGPVDWHEMTYTLGSGTHTLEWRYTKDSSISSGEDCGWVDKVEWIASSEPPPTDDLSEALDTSLSFTTGGSADWFGQSATSYYDGDAAQSGDISNNEDSWMRTTVSGAGTVSFYWKVSSEGYCDFLEFYIDGLIQDRISGSADWEQMMYTLPSGSHTLEWRYMKDYSMDSGSDCGWVDQIEWVIGSQPPPPSCDLSDALNTSLSFTTGGSADWFCQSATSYYDGLAAQSGDISHNQDSWIQTTISGPTMVSFCWKVSSESGYDYLGFYIDGVLQDSISGSMDWQQMMYVLPLGPHTLAWRYVKDGSTSSGSDCGWVDLVEWGTDPQPPPPTCDLSEALDTTLSFITGGDADWFCQSETAYYDGDAAQSGDISHDEESWMQMTVSGPATLSFYWKVSSESGCDFLEFYIDGLLGHSISGSRDWQQKIYTLGLGSHTLAWRYVKDWSDSTGSDCGWVDKVELGTSQPPSPDELSEALDTTLILFTGGEADWFAQSSTFYYDGDAAQSGLILHDEATWVETTVSGAGTFSFYWKVSSESDYDYLEFYIDGSVYDSISGLMDWQQMTYTLPSGSHTLEWRYFKDGSISYGSDCGWVDMVEWVASSQPPPGDLSEALDTSLSLTTGGDAYWFSQSSTFYYDGDAAQSGDISHNRNSWLQTTVSGAGTVSFYWKVSSEVDCDFLEFYINGLFQDRISGSVDWYEMTYALPSGSHALEWRYIKDSNMNSGSDCGWVDQVVWVTGSQPPPPPGDLSEALDTSLSLTTGGSADWFCQSTMSHYDGDAAQSGDISHNQVSWMRTAVSGPVTASFYWKVSSEGGFDCLEFYIDDVLQDSISGSMDWQRMIYTIPSGSHTLAWRYFKDSSVSFGSDCGWVDHVELGNGQQPPSCDLSEALDTTLSFTSRGDGDWFCESATSFYGGDAAQSGVISHNQESWMQTMVSGPTTLSFYWKLSSEVGCDFLESYIDGLLGHSISGSVDWQQRVYIIPLGSHTLEWRYFKDGSVNSGSDCGWVDRVELGTDQPPPPPGELSEALDTTLSLITGGEADWFFQSSTFYYDGDAAQSGDISHDEESWMQTTVSGAETVSFYWKVSSEVDCDFLEFYIEGVPQDSISGSVDWQQMMYTLGSGSHTLEWRYVKDHGVHSGSDCGWVDQVELVTGQPPPSCDLSEALDTSLSFTTGGSADWFGQTTAFYYDGDAAQSGDISHNQDSWLQTTLSGPVTVSFYWRVSSEDDYDFLEFYIDGSLQNRICGSLGWHEMVYPLTSGSHTLEWRYIKDHSVHSGSDCGWVDFIEVN